MYNSYRSDWEIIGLLESVSHAWRASLYPKSLWNCICSISHRHNSKILTIARASIVLLEMITKPLREVCHGHRVTFTAKVWNYVRPQPLNVPQPVVPLGELLDIQKISLRQNLTRFTRCIICSFFIFAIRDYLSVLILIGFTLIRIKILSERFWDHGFNLKPLYNRLGSTLVFLQRWLCREFIQYLFICRLGN